MARFSPRDPGFTPVPGFFDALSHIATSGARGFRGARDRQLAEEELERQRELEDVGLFRQGFRRGQQPTEEVPEEEDVFAGTGLGMQQQDETAPPIFQGARPGLAQQPAQQALESIQRVGAPTAPEVVALPGSYVEGLGFTPRAITSEDLVAHTRAAQAVPRRRGVAGTEQVTDDIFFDEAISPEGRQEARETRREQQERQRLETALRGLQMADDDIPPEIQAELVGKVPGSRLFPDEDENNIRVGGRLFPNTRAGEIAALEWQRVLADARSTRTPSAGPGEVTRRQFALAGARAMQRIREEVRDMSSFERRNLPPGYLNEQLNQVARAFGFASPRELEDEMRTLRVSVGGEGGAPEAGGGGAPPPGGSEGPTDEELAELVRQNPGRSPEELLELWEQGRR